MRERPILFSGPMVRALLAGTKTQTRRVVKPGALDDWNACPYGGIRGRLWVRETHALENRYRNVWCKYAADGHHAVVPAPELVTIARPGMRPSIHMPRWASRITLEIADVRVERLQDISIADAMAEGVVESNARLRGLEPCMEWRYAYEDLWRAINGAGSWDLNPWVWVVSFRRLSDV